MTVPLVVSGLLAMVAVAMLGASAAMRGRISAEGFRPGDDYLYAVAGGIVAVIAWLLAAAAIAQTAMAAMGVSVGMPAPPTH